MTPFVAATTTPGGLPWWAWIVLVLIGGGLVYLAECAWWPFAHCGKCEGRGKFKRKDRKVWRRCRRCKGSGERLRFGRKVWNRFARVRNAAK